MDPGLFKTSPGFLILMKAFAIIMWCASEQFFSVKEGKL